MSADDVTEVEDRLAGALDRAYTQIEADWGPRAAAGDLAAWGRTLHANFANEIRADPFLFQRVIYSPVGPDVQYPGENGLWELTTLGQETAHLSRPTWSLFAQAGWEVRWIIYS